MKKYLAFLGFSFLQPRFMAKSLLKQIDKQKDLNQGSKSFIFSV
jgi:hypothetical protein